MSAKEVFGSLKKVYLLTPESHMLGHVAGIKTKSKEIYSPVFHQNIQKNNKHENEVQCENQ